MALLLVVLFLVVPLVEIYVIIQVGQVIGVLETVVLLLIESAIGAWLVKREGRRAWQALRTAFSTGRLPTGELADAALVLVGGTLLLTPGFVTDIAGFFLVVPLTRPVARRLLGWLVTRRGRGLLRQHVVRGRAAAGHAGQAQETPRRDAGPSGTVVQGEVVTRNEDEPR